MNWLLTRQNLGTDTIQRMAALPGAGGDDRFTGEQAALLRVATLVTRGAAPEEVFASVTEEAGRLLGASFATMSRYDPDDARTIVATWSSAEPAFPVGNHVSLGGQNVPTLVRQTHRAARIDDYAAASGPLAEGIRACGLRASVGVPVSVEGRLWGVMILGSRAGPLASGTEARLTGFTELAATAIANARARVELREFADEQAALRRVATLVARAAPPAEVLTAITEEAGRLLHADYATMSRYGPDGRVSVVAICSTDLAFAIGASAILGGRNVSTMVAQTGQAARINDYADASGPVAKAAREIGLRASVGVPISVEGSLWGVMTAASRAEPLPAETEDRLTGFTELAATAIANARARVELRGFADEQAALRRVATLVARAAPPALVLTAITEEAGRLLHADDSTMGRYDPDGAIKVVATWGSADPTFPAGTQWSLGGQNLHTMIFRSHQQARIDDYSSLSSPVVEVIREVGIRAGVGVPVIAEGRLWGVMMLGSRAGPLPAGIEERLAGFTELAGTAIANAEARAALTSSRSRIVATADATRRRFERDLHDGAQQRLVSLALDLRAAEAIAPPGADQHVHQLDEVAAGMNGVLDDLREIARGLHPAILTDGGLQPALKALARRSAIPVDLDIRVGRRLPDQVEVAAYYAVSEALANAAKHASAQNADVRVTESDGVLQVRVRDNGRGGASFGHGSGLIGLGDRAEALGGHLDLLSPPGAGTTLEITLPLADTTQP